MRKPRRLTSEQLAPYQVDFGPVPRPSRADNGISTSEAAAAAHARVNTPAPISWPAVFGNDNPVELEVGFGKGLFLLTASMARPDRNFFGIEIVRKYQLYATTRIAIRKLPNVKTACGDAKRILREFVLPGSLDVIHVYFPDPWWKTRHKKRLLFTAEFAELVLRALRPGGQLFFVTDVRDYFQMVSGLLAEVPAFRPLPPPQESSGSTEMDYLTNFERKFRKEGRPIYRSAYEKST